MSSFLCGRVIVRIKRIICLLPLAILVMPQAHADDLSGLAPAFQLNYRFGAKPGQSALEFHAGFNTTRGYRHDAGTALHFNLAQFRISRSGERIEGFLAGMPLTSSYGLSADGEETGLSTTAKWGIGLGIVAGLAYAIGDAFDDGADDLAKKSFETDQGNEGDEQTGDEDEGAPICAVIVCTPD